MGRVSNLLLSDGPGAELLVLLPSCTDSYRTQPSDPNNYIVCSHLVYVSLVLFYCYLNDDRNIRQTLAVTKIII